MRSRVTEHIKDYYGICADYPFENEDVSVFRNDRNKKWFAVIMGGISKARLGIDSEDRVEIMNLKCDPMLSFTLVDNTRIFKGYHMNKEHWISVLLDGSVELSELEGLISMSYNIIDKKGKK